MKEVAPLIPSAPIHARKAMNVEIKAEQDDQADDLRPGIQSVEMGRKL
ncbi:hypothetical protein P3T40_006826 [Paraburkholderia sp. EB58]